MGSKRIGGIRFQAWSDDHEPIHVHAFIGNAILKVNLFADGQVKVEKSSHATASEIRKVGTVAAQAYLELLQLWKDAR